jgi:hypothetical protein
LTATDNGNGTATLTAFVSAGTHPLNDPQYPQFPGSVSFSVNGQSVGSRGAADPQDNVSITYTIPSSGSYTINATVTDSVLYSATDSVTANFTKAGAGPLTITDPTANQDVNASSYTIRWTGGSGTYSVLLNSVPVAGCTNISSTNCAVTLPGPNNTSFTATVTSGSESTSVTFKK